MPADGVADAGEGFGRRTRSRRIGPPRIVANRDGRIQLRERFVGVDVGAGFVKRGERLGPVTEQAGERVLRPPLGRHALRGRLRFNARGGFGGEGEGELCHSAKLAQAACVTNGAGLR